MTNDYKKGHRYRMKTDRDYRRRHDGRLKRPSKTRARKCKCGARASEYHHIRRGRGRWICKKCHARLHGHPRGKTPYR